MEKPPAFVRRPQPPAEESGPGVKKDVPHRAYFDYLCWHDRNNDLGSELMMPVGKVKWFNDAKGFGFIQQDGGEDVFCHQSAIQMTGRRNLQEGQQVEFDVNQGPKGLQAANVRVID